MQDVANDFLRVFRKEDSVAITDMNKPFEIIFCTYVLGIHVPANATLRLEIPWVSLPVDYPKDHFCIANRNEASSVGYYQTVFTNDFKYITVGGESCSGSKSLKWEFRVLNK